MTLHQQYSNHIISIQCSCLNCTKVPSGSLGHEASATSFS